MRELKSRSDKSEMIGYSFITFFSGIILGKYINTNSIICDVSWVGIIAGILILLYNKISKYIWWRDLREDLK